MKPALAIISLIVVAALTSLVCEGIHSAREAPRQAELFSDVNFPLRECLDDIVSSYDHGDASGAEQKARLLQRRWSEYLKGGPPPGQFSNEVMRLGSHAAATQP
jgi:hypothetical protein